MTEPSPIRRFYDLPDGRMSALHFGPQSQAVELVFCHANGFNGLTYRSILEPLGIHSVAIDLRGHGMSELPTDISSLKSFHIFARDITYFITRYLDKQIIMAGHSLGAVAAILTAPTLKDRIKAYVGFDPVSLTLLPRLTPYIPGGQSLMLRTLPIVVKAGKRRGHFENPQAAFDRYQGRGAFKGVKDEVLWDYLAGGLVEDSQGVRLACDPAWEQLIYTAQGHNLYKAARHLPDMSKFVYAGQDHFSTKSTRAKVANIIGADNVIFHSDYYHLFPLQEPDMCTALLKDVIQG